ncbi:hypothetical protein AB0E69_00630 [Kribbella sp. NPDC026611]|uniref:hypothetical protein n=1 Tax=Kribbella sp. NPDC026611 TaxID=3154911 RepID=UPI0033D983F5
MLTTPRWILAVLVGFACSVLAAGLVGLAGQGLFAAVVAGAVVGVLGGLLMSELTARRRTLLRAATGDLPPAILLAASRAALRGPAPSDPEVRAAALAIVSRNQSVAPTRGVAGLLPVMALGPIVLVLSTGTFTPVDGVIVFFAALSAALLTFGIYLWPRHLRNRLRQLS